MKKQDVEVDDLELIAVITAAIAASEGYIYGWSCCPLN